MFLFYSRENFTNLLHVCGQEWFKCKYTCMFLHSNSASRMFVSQPFSQQSKESSWGNPNHCNLSNALHIIKMSCVPQLSRTPPESQVPWWKHGKFQARSTIYMSTVHRMKLSGLTDWMHSQQIKDNTYTHTLLDTFTHLWGTHIAILVKYFSANHAIRNSEFINTNWAIIYQDFT